MSVIMQPPVGRAPRKGLQKVAAAVRRLLQGPAPGEVRREFPQTWEDFGQRFLYQARWTSHTEAAHTLWQLLSPQLYERHWTDRQVWFMLDWLQLEHQIFRHPTLQKTWVYDGIPVGVRQELLEHMQKLGFAIQRPLPPQTDTTVLITWRAGLYFAQ